MKSMSRDEGSGGLNKFDSVVSALPSTSPLPACAEIDSRTGLVSICAPSVCRWVGATNNSSTCVVDGTAVSNVPEVMPISERLDEFAKSTAVLSTLFSAALACVVLIKFQPLLIMLPRSCPLPAVVLTVIVIGLV